MKSIKSEIPSVKITFSDYLPQLRRIMIFIIIVNIIIIVIVIITIIIVIVKIVIIITIQICVPFSQVSRPMVRRYRGIFLLFDTRILDKYEIPQLPVM